MALYGAAKAPAVPKNGTGTTVVASTDSTGGVASVTDTLVPSAVQADTDANFATLNAKIEELIAHMNDGRA